ncbi:unnamed protein product, partial [Mesorhabditis belari]|uniref:Uncharacterized protein n=1 Tax=Mesorhabditis belari TaxID=2138241 RepID=A0AAF3FE00_9BILA
MLCSFLFLSFAFTAPSPGNGAGVNDLGNGARPQHDYPVPINNDQNSEIGHGASPLSKPPQPIGGTISKGNTRVKRKVYWNNNEYFRNQHDYSGTNPYAYRSSDNSQSRTSYYNRNSYGYPFYDDPNGSFHIGQGALPYDDPNNGGNGQQNYYNPYENQGNTLQRIDFHGWGK